MDERTSLIDGVLTEIADIARELTGARSGPFADRRLSRNQLDALFVLAHAPRPVTAGALAEALTVTPGAVTQLVGVLREAGLVDSGPSHDDGRVRVIELTAHARAQVEEFERAAAERMAPRFAAVADHELRELISLLRKRGTAL